MAGVTAVALASAGVSMVGEQVTDSSRGAPLSAEQVRGALSASALGGGSTATTEPSSVTTTTPVATTISGGPTTTVDGGGPPATLPQGGGPTAITTTTTTTPASTPATTRTYNLVGGTATLRFTPAGVTVVSAVPKAGFSVDVSPDDGEGARVEFESESHDSRVDGWWDAGPQDEVREED